MKERERRRNERRGFLVVDQKKLPTMSRINIAERCAGRFTFICKDARPSVHLVALALDRVLSVCFLGVIDLESRQGEDVLVALVIRSLHHLSCVGLVLFHIGIVGQTDILVHIKTEEWSRLSTGLVDNKVVEGVMVRDDQILLHIHHVVNTDTTQLLKLLPALFQKLCDCISLLALQRERD